MNWKKYNKQRTYRMGGKQLPGGIMSKLPGGAVEFTGQTHDEGGILLDANTEVEHGETMDEVFGRDYFFSNHLKLNGSTFAALHKRMLARNASQAEINALAERQELVSGRSKSGGIKEQVIQAEYGGYRTKRRKLEEGGYASKALDWELLEKIVPYLGKMPHELEEEFGSSEIPAEYLQYLRTDLDFEQDGKRMVNYVLKQEYMRHDMMNPYGARFSPEELADRYMESNTGQFENGIYYPDEEETGDLKFDELDTETQNIIIRYRGLMTPVQFNKEYYPEGERTKAGLTAFREQIETDKEEGIESYDSWYDVPAGASDKVRVAGVVYKKSDDGTEWVNEDGTAIDFTAGEEERKSSANLETEIRAEYEGEYTDEELEIMRKQQILVDAGYDLGDTGPNEDGVDGDWGNKSEEAWDKHQKKLKKETEMNNKEIQKLKNKWKTDISTEDFDGKVMERLGITQEDWDAKSDLEKWQLRDQVADQLVAEEEVETKETEARKIRDAEYIQQANRAARISESDSNIDMSEWALVDVGGEMVYVPYDKRHSYSSIPGQENSDPVKAGEANQLPLAKQEEAIGTGLSEGTYTDDVGNLWEKDSQGRWRVKYMSSSEFGDPTLDEEWTVLSPDMYPGEMNLTPYKEKKSMLSRLQNMKMNNDLATMAASAAQMIPAYMAYKDTPDYMATPGQVPMTKLDRVNYNNDRMTAAADYRALSRGIELKGTGPGEIANKMMAYSKKQAANMAITARETQENTKIANREEELNKQAISENIKNNMIVDEFNRAADAATTDRKIEAVQNAMTALAGMNRDRLQYEASKNLTIATAGETGVMSRFDLRIKAMQIAGTTDIQDPRYIAALNSLQKTT